MAATVSGWLAAAPRIGPTLLAAVERLDDESLPIAEVHRRVAALASHLGCLEAELRADPRSSSTSTVGAGLRPTAGQILLDVAARSRPPEALLELLEGAK